VKVTRANLIDGAIVSVLPHTLEELLPFFGEGKDSTRSRVVSIRWLAEYPAELSPQIGMSWSVLSFQPASAH
jgi:hypothetical protein